MKVLIDIGHPAHVHLFINFAHKMQNRSHQVQFTCRNREFVLDLLEQNGLEYKSFGNNFSTPLGKIVGLFLFTWKMWRVCRRFKPDILLSHSSMYAAFAAFLVKKPHISFEDTFNFEQIRLYKPFTKTILTGTYPHQLKSRKVIPYNGYHELAYLYPLWFCPDVQVLEDLGIAENQPYIIMRFVSWSASHDIGHHGMTLKNKIEAVIAFSDHAKVFISSELPLPSELEPYRFPLPPGLMHHAMAFASLIFGESATMVSEGAMLGIPGIYLDNTGRLYTRELQEKYGMVFNYSESPEDQLKAIQKGVELLTTPNIKEQWQLKRQKMLREKIDVTAFLVWFIENYPGSVQVMKDNPEYQWRFR